MLKVLNINPSKRVFFVGDIHGCIKTLNKGLELINFKEGEDILIATGDLGDRGPSSLEVYEKFIDDGLTDSYYSVLGNHDNFIIEDLWYSDHIRQGGSWYCFGIQKADKLKVKDYISTLPICIQCNIGDKKLAITHAEIPVDVTSFDDYKSKHLDKGIYNPSIWNRYAIRDDDIHKVDGIDWSIHGHSFTEEPVFMKNRLYIDTGCVFSREDEPLYLTFAEYKYETDTFEFTKVLKCG